MTAERKREAREKFLLGGIVVKAGLSKADRAFLLGGLLELARIVPGSLEHQRLRDIGEVAFKASSPDAVWEKAEWH
ncbi:conjugal transfer TraD protein [Rhizobium gallicum]|uniref:Conjugal transfer TraD protein n=1 Tax=Rhizobium gallicum TaxID=56730 RepID=A0A1L5NLU8_9HYPH|nr:conjugal transfer protein TraD [Rhizobium gallicum]APO68863.1 conjugal transfer TraD protein [Rhizobium gallicum]